MHNNCSIIYVQFFETKIAVCEYEEKSESIRSYKHMYMTIPIKCMSIYVCIQDTSVLCAVEYAFLSAGQDI